MYVAVEGAEQPPPKVVLSKVMVTTILVMPPVLPGVGITVTDDPSVGPEKLAIEGSSEAQLKLSERQPERLIVSGPQSNIVVGSTIVQLPPP